VTLLWISQSFDVWFDCVCPCCVLSCLLVVFSSFDRLCVIAVRGFLVAVGLRETNEWGGWLAAPG
jgi:hypothetical protein